MKKLFYILLAMSMLLCFSACSSDVYSEDDSSIDNSSTQTESDDIDYGSQYLGDWERDGLYLRITPDWYYTITDATGEILSGGICQYDKEGLTLISDEDESTFFVVDASGNLYCSEQDISFSPVKEQGGEDDTGSDDTGSEITDNDDTSSDDTGSNDNGGQTQQEPIPQERYYGYWTYPNDVVINIDPFGWSLYDDEGNVIDGGSVEYEADAAYLMTSSGSSGGGKVYFKDGDLYDGDQLLGYSEESPFYEEEVYFFNEELEGDWLYSDVARSIYFDGVESFTWQKEQEIFVGTYTYDGEVVMFYYEDFGGEEEGYLGEDGYLYIVDDYDCYYYRYE